MVQPILCVHSNFYLVKYGLVCTLYYRMYPRIPTKKILLYKILTYDTEYSPLPNFWMFSSSRSHLSKKRFNDEKQLGCTPQMQYSYLVLIVYLLQIITYAVLLIYKLLFVIISHLHTTIYNIWSDKADDVRIAKEASIIHLNFMMPGYSFNTIKNLNSSPVSLNSPFHTLPNLPIPICSWSWSCVAELDHCLCINLYNRWHG